MPRCVLSRPLQNPAFQTKWAVAQLATALLDVISWIRPAGAAQTASVRCEGPIHHHSHAANGANGGDIAGTGTDYRSNSNGDSSHHNTEDVAGNKRVPLIW
jgi:hypothetical protein